MSAVLARCFSFYFQGFYCITKHLESENTNAEYFQNIGVPPNQSTSCSHTHLPKPFHRCWVTLQSSLNGHRYHRMLSVLLSSTSLWSFPLFTEQGPQSPTPCNDCRACAGKAWFCRVKWLFCFGLRAYQRIVVLVVTRVWTPPPKKRKNDSTKQQRKDYGRQGERSTLLHTTHKQRGIVHCVDKTGRLN